MSQVFSPTILMIGSFLSAAKGSFSVGEGLAAELSKSGAHVHLTSHQPNKFLRLLDMLQSIWRYRSQIDLALVEVYSGTAFVWAEACCRLLKAVGKPYILILHGGNLPEFSTHQAKRVKRLLASAASVIAPSPYLQQSLRKFRPDIQWIPNPLKLDCYPFHLRDQPQPHLVWLRAFHHIYHPTMVPKLLELLQADFPSVHIRMVGPDKGDGSLQETIRLAKKLGVDDHLEIVGSVPKQEVPLQLDRGDIFINTTDVDNSPVSVVEAMACGLCVVSTNVGGIPYLLENEVDSLLTPAGDAAAMANAIRRLFNEPGLAGKLSSAGRKKVTAYDWSFVLPKWQELISHSVKVQQEKF